MKTWQDALSKPFTLAGEGSGSDPDNFARILRNVFGAKVKLVHGYKGAPGVKLAIEKGEVAGICGMPMSTLHAQWSELLGAGRIRPVIQLSGAKGAVPGVDYVYDLAQSEEDRRVFDLIFGILRLGKPVVAPPGVPVERVAALRMAFDATMRDEQFKADAARQRIDISPATGAQVEAFIARIYATPRAAVERAKAAVRYTN